MPDSIVDKSGYEDTASNTPAEATTPKDDAAPDRPRTGAERRIAELIKKGHDNDRAWQGKYNDLMAEVSDLRAEIAQVRGASGEKKPAKGPIVSSIADFQQEDLDNLLAQGPADNPALYAAAVREDRRRWGEEQKKIIQTSSQQELRANELRMRGWAEIQKRYGAEVDNADSDLRQRAEQHMARMRRDHGPNVVKDMNAQNLAFALAHHDLHAQDQEQLSAARREVDRMKQSQALESGARGAAKLTSEVDERLKKRDVKGAVGRLAREMLQD